MTTLEQLIGNPSVTVEQIFAATDDVREIMDAAQAVFAHLERACAAAESANDQVVRAVVLAKIEMGEDGYEERMAALRAAGDAAHATLDRVFEAQRRYAPWSEPLSCLREAREIMRQIESKNVR